MALYTVVTRALKDPVLFSTCSIVHDISSSASMHFYIADIEQTLQQEMRRSDAT